MEVYILDALLRRETVVDRFESLIWTERFADVGDFELVVQSTRANRALFVAETKLATNDSYRVMVVKSVENKTDSDGKSLLTVKGYSLEETLKSRIAKMTTSNLITDPAWVITGTPGNVARTMFDQICRVGALNAGDKIPFITPGTIFSASTIPEPAFSITLTQPPAPLFDAIKGVCDIYDLGFRLVRNFDTSQLYFDIYSGSDRTTDQTSLPPVVFSPDLDNLQNTTEFTSTDGAKNCAYVFSNQGFEVVYPLGVAPDVAGFDRHVHMVQAEDIPGSPTAAQVSAALQQLGKDELAKLRSWSAFDGEFDQSSVYKYGRDYELGDLVEMRNSDGMANNMRVTEQIFVSDSEGDRSYPTLAINLFITPGSWLSWNYNQVWHDLDSDTTSVWANQP